MPCADEMQTVGYCLGTWWDGFYSATHSQNMSVGYWLISKVLLSVTGPNFIAMRVVSGVAFVLFAILLLRLLLKWLPIEAAVATTLVVVVHPALVWHARDGQVYSILLLVETLSVALLLARPFRGRGLLWVAASAAMVYLHHHALFVLAIQALVILDRRRDMIRLIPCVAVLVLPDLLFVYWAMESPNVAGRMFDAGQMFGAGQTLGAGQTFASNVLLAVGRLGAGIPEVIPLPLPEIWRQGFGGIILLAAALITAVRGRTVQNWLGLVVPWILIAPAAAHHALDVFYEPRFIIVAIPPAIVWLMSSVMIWPGRRSVLIIAAVLAAVFLWTDLEIIRPHISPYRPTRADVNADLVARPGKIVMHPGYLVGCWWLPDGFDTAGGVVLSEAGATAGVEKTIAGDNAIRYSADMPWSRFRQEIVKGESFTLIQGVPGLYPRAHADFCKPDTPWETDYRLRYLWTDHPFVTIIRFEKTPR